jgi:signal transduction histidine kinase
MRFGIALLPVVLAFVLTVLLDPLFPYPFLFLFVGAVMVSAWFAGLSGGLLAVLASTLLIDYYFIPPLHSFSVSISGAAYSIAFALCALAASWLSSEKRNNEQALMVARDQLEVRVLERTAVLMKRRADLVHLSQVLSMSELAGSIAQEVKQPLTAVVTNGLACAEWLSPDHPNLEKARQTVQEIIQEGTRAGAVVSRIRDLFRKESPIHDWLDINDVIREFIVLVHDEARRRNVVIRADLSPGMPKVQGDRVQLQRVLFNLFLNAFDAMSDPAVRQREIHVRSRTDEGQIVVQVEDSGTGLDAESAEKIFQPFFTTKASGVGLGLPISRSIIESHGGLLEAVLHASKGAEFQFTLPVEAQESAHPRKAEMVGHFES